MKRREDVVGRRIGITRVPAHRQRLDRVNLHDDHGVRPSHITWVRGGIDTPAGRKRSSCNWRPTCAWNLMMHRTTFVLAAALTSCGPALSGPATAQPGFPTKAIKLVVPYAPGGLPDTVARIVGRRLQDALGQPVLVDNRPGGNGGVAATALSTAPPDGHTLLVTDGSMLTINRLLSSKMSYDPDKDFVPVSLVAQAPLFLAVNPKVAAKTLDEFIALAKSKPGGLTYGSSGVGSSHHLTAEALNAGCGTAITHVPYKGSANSVPALIGGQVDMVFAAYPSLSHFVKSGQARILATNAAKRSALAPDVPAIAERLPGFDFAVLVVMLAPRATPLETVQRLSTEVAKILKHPDVIEQLRVAGIDPIGGAPEQMDAALKAEATRVTAAVKRANLKTE